MALRVCSSICTSLRLAHHPAVASRRHFSSQMTAAIRLPESGSPQDNLLIRDPRGLDRKLERLRTMGPKNLQVITDFDMTLTKFKHNGARLPSSHAIVENCNLLTREYHEEVVRLKSHYYPIEVDHRLPHDEKVKHMEAWWDKAHTALLNGGFNRNIIPGIVASADIRFREGVGEMFHLLHMAGVPCLVFSAGLGDVIEEVLRQHFHMDAYDHVHVVSNFIEFDPQTGTAVRFPAKNIHVLNKNEKCIRGTRFAADVASRHNVILLGDSLGDIGMSNGVQCDEIVRVGFLNDNIEDRTGAYMDAFDIVVLNDGDMSVVLDMLHTIMSQ